MLPSRRGPRHWPHCMLSFWPVQQWRKSYQHDDISASVDNGHIYKKSGDIAYIGWYTNCSAEIRKVVLLRQYPLNNVITVVSHNLLINDGKKDKNICMYTYVIRNITNVIDIYWIMFPAQNRLAVVPVWDTMLLLLSAPGLKDKTLVIATWHEKQYECK